MSSVLITLVTCVACGASDDSPQDGTTGGTSGGGTGGTSSGGTGGSSGCTMLEASYASTLAEAKECPLFGGTPDCSTSVDDRLACPCKTFAQASSAALLADLTSIREQWTQAGCDRATDCSTRGQCKTPTSATCQSGGQGGDVGYCKDAP